MGKESREITHTFHFVNPFPFLATCNFSYRKLASSKFENTTKQIIVANPSSFQ
jgi:hypothetical protein